MKKTLLVVLGLAIASLAAAQLSKYKDWPKSPEAYLLTPEERAEWSKVAGDADAEKFIAAYYARRGGERFKEEIARRIAAADEQFKMRRQRGAESVRGRLLIALGGPSRVAQSRSAVDGGATADTGLGRMTPPGTDPFASGPEAGAGGPVIQTWIYEKNKFDPSWGIGELRLRVVVDPQRGADELRDAAPADRAIAIIAEKSIVNPSATGAAPAGAPAAQPAIPAAATGTVSAPAPAAMAPAPATASLPASTRASLEALVKTAKSGPGFWGGTFHSLSGTPFYALEFYFDADKAPAAGAKFGGVVTSETGGEVASFWEDAALADMKTGTRVDKVYERSIVLPAGSYRAAFGVYPAEGASAAASASAAFKLEPKPTEFEVSPLILTNELRPLTKRPAETDPFVFGVTKPIKVEPKGDHVFSKQDSLWYFYEVTNPKLPEAPAAPAAAPPSATPAPGAAPAPAPAAAAEVKPRIMQRISVLKDGKPAFAPFTGPAEMQLLAPGAYASGSEIPLATFDPGYYTFGLNVRDLNAPRDSAAFKGTDRQENFIVLKPDGSLPEKTQPKAAAPAATPKPRPKSKS